MPLVNKCTNRTFQLQPRGARNSVCISRVCVTGTVSTCTFPIFAGFSTCEAFLVCPFPYPREGWPFACLPFPEIFPLFVPFDVCGWVLPISWSHFFPLPVPVPLHLHGFDLLPDAFDVHDFTPAPVGDLTFFLQHHFFNLIFRQGSIVVLVKAVQLQRVERFYFCLCLCPSLPGSIRFSANFELCRLQPLSTILTASSRTCRSAILSSFSKLSLSFFSCFLFVCHLLKHGSH